jgi:lysophosphatidylcholine acyltransferase/lyso-PAF acetyltransferase
MSQLIIPNGHIFEETEKDAFIVDSIDSLWKSIPIFFIMLPFTLLCLFMTLIVAGIILPMYRNRSLATRNKLSKIITFWLMSTARFKIKVIDHNDKSEDHAQMYVAPHICMLEAMMMIYSVGHIRPMTAEFTKNIPVFGFFVDASDPIYVSRGGEKGKPKVSVVKQLRESVETTSYRHLIFPEGTFTNGKSLIQFKSGAFAVGKPVTPMVFSYSHYTPFWNREESSFLIQIFRIVSRFYTPIQIEYLPTYYPSEEELTDVKLYAENVREIIAFHTKRPLSKQSLVDSPNYQKDRKKKKT